MRIRCLESATLCVTVSMSCVSPSFSQTGTYVVTELSPSGENTVALGINNLGQVVGRGGTDMGTRTRSLYWPTGSKDRPTQPILSVMFSSAAAINDAGDVVGTLNAGPSNRAFVWNKKGVQNLPAAPGDTSSQAFAINKRGAVAGYSSGSQGARAVIWSNKAVSNVLGALPGGKNSRAFGINDHDQVVGSSETSAGARAFVWSQRDGMRDLGTLPGDTSSEARSINNAGSVVGYSAGNRGMRAFLWTSSKGMEEIGVLPGGDHSKAMSISNSGEVLGTSTSSSGLRAFIWTRNEGMRDLNTLIAGNFGSLIIQAHASNDKGQILTLGMDRLDSHVHEGATRVFLLTPAAAGGPGRIGP